MFGCNGIFDAALATLCDCLSGGDGPQVTVDPVFRPTR